MSTLQPRLHFVIRYRETGRHDEARQVLLEPYSEFPEDPQVSYPCAWIHDLLGLERESIRSGLGGDELIGAPLGIGSTCRAIRFFADNLEQTC